MYNANMWVQAHSYIWKTNIAKKVRQTNAKLISKKQPGTFLTLSICYFSENL